MEIVMGIFTLVVLGLATLLSVIIRKVAFASGDLPVTAEWIDDLSVERYRPMLRLLDGKDLAFLRIQPGFTPRMETQLRRQRCQIFQGYLRALSLDFRRVCAAIKLVILYSKNDRPELAAALIQQQVFFGLAYIQVQFSLQLYRWGVCAVNVSSLIRLFDFARLELKNLVPAEL
ncbi:MAG TPA: hypothetical protein VMH20_16180 [Verrucomicrobiae bacterium]|jgi:hypothetical protein|nr:hypothetical protein [Verrucomicrobiae bacterium]